MMSLHEKTGFSSKRVRLYFVCFLLVICTAFAYWNIDKCGFINYDDPDYVSKNYHIFSGFTTANLYWAFSSFYAANWHPLTWLSHMLDNQL
jgi:protein O-mannosyl-transferase